jgi:hypothetical protein
MSTVSRIGNALGYDAVESMLARGCSLRDCYAFAALALDVSESESNDSGPVSNGPTEYPATVRPGKQVPR